MTTTRIRVILLAVVLLLYTSAAIGADPPPPVPAGSLNVFVSIPPQAYFVERIGGPHVTVGVLVGPGQSPHSFEPSPKQLAMLAKARVFFAVGWPFEKRLLEKVTATSPNLRIIDTRQGVPLRYLTPEEAHADEEPARPGEKDADHDHAAGEADPHIWLSPRLAKTQAATICRGLSDADPAHRADYEKSLKALQDDLDKVDQRLAKALEPVKGKAFLTFHPAFGYFADAYGLKQVPVEVGGKEPSARQLAQLIARARDTGARVIFVQPQFSARSAEAVAQAIGGAVVPMDAMAKDYLTNLDDMAAKVRSAVK